MAFFDLSLKDLESYLPARTDPADFDAFWANTLAEARRFPLEARFDKVDWGLQTVDTYDVTFAGFAGQPIKGWLLVPAHAHGPLACVVEYIGYGGGRGFPFNWLTWSAAGYAHFIMDTRGQGSSWQQGDTPDLPIEPDNPAYPGFMTRGILNPKTYYYRRVYTDAVRAIDAARTHPAVDPKKILTTGASQGGGLAVAAAGLVPDLAAVMPHVPFLSHFRRATEITNTHPYQEIAAFCRTHRHQIETVFETLAYFDGVNFAARANAPTLYGIGLMDEICPPSTVYASFNHYGGGKALTKQIAVYPYNNHEGGAGYWTAETLKFAAAYR
jgi:cephalosporin-C deacetylase